MSESYSFKDQLDQIYSKEKNHFRAYTEDEKRNQLEKVDNIIAFLDVVIKHSDHVVDCFNKLQDRVDNLTYENMKLQQIVRDAYPEHYGRKNFKDLFYDDNEILEFKKQIQKHKMETLNMMNLEEHEIKLKAFINAYNRLENFKMPYTKSKDSQGMALEIIEFTIPEPGPELEKYIQLTKELEKARQELNAETN